MQSTHIRCLWLSPRFFLNGSENKKDSLNKMNLLLDRWCSSPWMKKKKVFKNSLRIDIRMTDGITEGRVLSFQITFLSFFTKKNWQITILGTQKLIYIAESFWPNHMWNCCWEQEFVYSLYFAALPQSGAMDQFYCTIVLFTT